MTPEHRLAVEIMYFDLGMAIDAIAFDRGWFKRLSVSEVGPVIREAIQRRKMALSVRERDGITLAYKGEELTIQQWAERTGISHQTLRHRIRAGWDVWSILHTKPKRTVKEAA